MSSQTNAVCIRRARPGDAAAIAQIHVQSWVETYSDLLPRDFMDNLMTVEDRTVFWNRVLNGERSQNPVFISEKSDGEIVGFIACGPQRSEQFVKYEGEIYAIYSLRKYQKQGIGRALMERAMQSFRKRIISSASCVVLGKNQRACQFYEALGGEVLGEVIDERPTGPLHETVYGWSDLSRFTSD